MKSLLIGLVGPKGVGKTTIAKRLVKAHGEYEGTVISFADPMRKMVSVGLGIPVEVLRDEKLKEQVYEPYGVSPRHIMQTLGTEWGRTHISQDLWVRAWRETAMSVDHDGYLIVVDDVRFENEAQMIRDLGGTLVRLVRENIQYADNHASEGGYRIKCDLSFENVNGVMSQRRIKRLYNECVERKLNAERL
jgi:hypothetical protein